MKRHERLWNALEALNPVSLGAFPTPLMHLPRLTEALGGPDLWIKRDDLTGLGMGGNKIRKLQYLLADARRQDADLVMTTGAQQSNHARQTAAAAAHVGLGCALVLGGDAPESAQGNYLLDRFLGAEIHWAGDRPLMSALKAEAQRQRKAGRRPYVIPYGGSNALGVCGFVEGLLELYLQTRDQELNFDAILIASSSGGTQSGLIVGARALGWETRIVGVSIAEQEATLKDTLATLTVETEEQLGLSLSLDPETFIVLDDYLGGGYGVVSDLEKNAVGQMARLEGLLCDPVYTGRALGGLIDLVQQGIFDENNRILFWHTGGTPALFAYAEELLA